MTRAEIARVTQQETAETLRRCYPQGSTVYGIARKHHASGTTDVSFVAISDDGAGGTFALHPNYSVAKVMGYRLVTSDGHDAVRIRGVGFDKVHDVAQRLGGLLYRDSDALRHGWL